MQEKEITSICPANRKDWRQWLEENHASKKAVWLICYKKKATEPTVTWSEMGMVYNGHGLLPCWHFIMSSLEPQPIEKLMMKMTTNTK